MALTRVVIEFNFGQAKRQADELDNIANNLENLSDNQFGGTMQNISANWKGENATAYLSKGGILQGDMTQTASSLHGIADEIRAVAQRIYNAEMAALAIAEQRTY